MGNWGKYSKVKLRPSDTKFSRFIRERDNWRCVYRFKCFGGESFRSNPGGLDCSHFQKRGKENVRYDPENADAACKKCHWFIENDPEGQRTLERFKEKQLGARRYALLILRSNQYAAKDEKLAILIVNALIKEYQDKIRAGT